MKRSSDTVILDYRCATALPTYATWAHITSVLCLQLRTLVLNILDGVVTKLMGLVVGQVRRSPLGRGPWGSFLEHAVDLLKRQSLSLRDKEEGKDECAGTEGSPDEEDLTLEVGLVLADHVWGDDSDDGVPEPVGCGRETDTARANW